MNRRPSHPGALIRNVILPETRLTVSSLAARCGVARNTMSKIVNERGALTEDIAIRLSRVLGSPEFWLAMQSRLTLWRLERENKDVYDRKERVDAA